MTIWIPCPEGFIAADVIRWSEGVWGRRGPAKSRAFKIGDRDVTAEVLEGPDKDGFFLLLVRDCKIFSEEPARCKLDRDAEIRRKGSTIMRGDPDRMIWSDEAARVMVRSPFVGPEAVPTRPRKQKERRERE